MDTWSMDMVMRGGSDLTWHIFRFQDGLKMRNGMNIPRKIGQMRIWWRHYPVGFQLTLINDATARVPCMHSVFYFIFNIFHVFCDYIALAGSLTMTISQATLNSMSDFTETIFIFFSIMIL